MSTNGTEHELRSRGSYVVFVGLEIERERERKKPVTSFFRKRKCTVGEIRDTNMKAKYDDNPLVYGYQMLKTLPCNGEERESV